ncbi:hypothetical protein GCK72_015842 [Caenorhabditis remanei]|uniref:F-box domain-containing protein n=1 Tax=Caenorhabditis remanei TaxID=31234 RepID=A0A6A5GXW1_CAERE|nr:hypothetical protein GCK72_015842 [Caenorhabditis remanei]KAF1759375.1 hypothetical protein GCK72_015842 [Caenorhabditis remanei]
MPALPILKLPIIVLMKILRSIDIETLIPISLCSRKMYYLVKNFRDKSISLKLRLDGGNPSVPVQVLTPESYCHQVEIVTGKYGNLEQVNFNGHLVPIDRSREEGDWKTYWNDKEEGIHSVLDYLSDLFGIKKIIRITLNYRNEVWLLNLIEKRQGNDYELEIHSRLSEEDCHFILKNYHPKGMRVLSLNPGNFPISQYLKPLEFLFSHWMLSITLDDVLNTNCEELVLLHNEFTESEIKRILQHWAIGGFKRLKFLGLYAKDLNLGHVLEDLDGLTHSRMTEKRAYISSTTKNVSFSDYLITRNDGVVASFRYYDRTARVAFGVWPDSEGNEY